ncbi:alkaline phosphatase family protein [Bacillus sp. Marseille-Q1617]|uniref:alkaline phosphatase family protein n=1 Tax=Bacillus sp. Marseille-Q1617 TaxID=2736887 RepID=UPI00158E523A|nr:alkaline phosphatase family protein [Bacillus sp. Marseille-Q1617]
MIKRLVFIFSFLIFVIGCTGSSQVPSLDTKKPLPLQTGSEPHPKVILLVIDSLMEEPLNKAIEDGKAPALEFLKKNGQYSTDLVSSYPTMSVTIDSSLITGTYPDQHKIPGLVWFDDKERRIITYGNGFFEILKLGVSDFAKNGLYAYNNQDLSSNVKTIHEDLDNAGFKTASINALIYRGNHPHTLKVPGFISAVAKLPDEIQTMGPETLSLGVFSRENQENHHIVNRIGLNDSFAAEELTYLLKTNTLPSFTILYLPENDFTVHRKGPSAIKGIEDADKQLQNVLNSFPDWNEALDNLVWVIMGDSNQSLVKSNKKEALIDLRKELSEYNILKLGEAVRAKDEIVITANERMAYVYMLKEDIQQRGMAEKLQKESRIAWIAWKDNEGIKMISPDHQGELSFKPGGPYRDQYHQTWSVKGNIDILDMKVNENTISFGDYPDALARLYGAAESQNGRFLITDAKPGYEFIGESSPEHSGGGAHGSMHKADSKVPLIVSGTDKNIENLRIVDLKGWIMEIIQR